MNKNILLFGLVFGFNVLNAESVVVDEKTSCKECSDKIIETVTTTKSDGTITIEIIEKLLDGKIISQKIEKSFDPALKELGYIFEKFFENWKEEYFEHPLLEAMGNYGDAIANEEYGCFFKDSPLFKESSAKDYKDRLKVFESAIQRYGINYQSDTFPMSLLWHATHGLTHGLFKYVLSVPGIEVNKEIVEGVTVLHTLVLFASDERKSEQKGYNHAMKDLKLLLIHPDINLQVKTSHGHTAEDIARILGDKECEALLKEVAEKQKSTKNNAKK